MMKVRGAPAADDLDDDAAREISSSRPAPVQGAGRRGLRGVTHSVLQLHRMAPRDPADHLMTKGKSASATDDSDDRAARRRCGSSPAPTEPHSVAPVSYNVRRLATRRAMRAVFTGARESARRRQPHCLAAKAGTCSTNRRGRLSHRLTCANLGCLQLGCREPPAVDA
jgi:hypothetical protein